jgi:hypothetical protein
MTDRLTIIRSLEKEIADKKAALAKELAKKEIVKKGDIIIVLKDLEWVCSKGAKMEVHSVSGGHIHAGVIGRPSCGTFWINDGDYLKYMDGKDFVTGIQTLKYSNNWENDVYTIQGHRVIDLKQVSIHGKKYEVTSKSVSVGYSDHGHSYTSTSTHYFVTEYVFGKPKVFDLNTLMRDHDVKAIQYTLEYDLS